MLARIYFDNAATTPIDPRVRAAIAPYLDEAFGNPSSLHTEGRVAHDAVEAARSEVAALCGALPKQVVFTSGGTEANHLALLGVVRANAGQRVHILTSAIEHPAVRELCRWLEQGAVDVTYLRCDGEGLIDPDELKRAMRPQTRLVSIMAGSNVVGTIQPLRELAEVARARGALFHTDAVQAVGKIHLDMQRDGIDLLSLSGHKLYGPKGIGALVVRDGVSLGPVSFGGGQERGYRSGTENVPGIVGLGVAAGLCIKSAAYDAARIVGLQQRLIDGVLARVSQAYLIGHRFRRLPGLVCFGLDGLEGEAIKVLLALDEAGVAVSSGSACSAHRAGEPSYVLTALGFDPLRARGALRISLGRFNTEAEVERFIQLLPSVVAALRPLSGRARPAAGGRA